MCGSDVSIRTILCAVLFCIIVQADGLYQREPNRRNHPNAFVRFPGDTRLAEHDRWKKCTTYRGRRGSCEPISSCPGAYRHRFRSFRRSRYPNICYWDYEYDEPVVCCPKSRDGNPRRDRPTTPHWPPEIPDTSSGICGIRPAVSYENANADLRLRGTYIINPVYSIWPNHPKNLEYIRQNHGSYFRKNDELRTTSEPLPSAPSSIVGGREVTPRGWPWMAALFLKNNQGGVGRFLCGASLISNRYILTAAHCFTVNQGSKDPSRYLVILGAHTIRGNERDGEIYKVSEVKVHEGFRQGQHYNDIALIRLSRKASSSMTPVCLPDAKDANANLTGKQATVTGWGDLAFGGVVSNVLREVTVPIMSNKNCSDSYERLRLAKTTFPRGIDNSLLCAGHPEGGKDACQGDSGGPLVLKLHRNVWQQIGIVSFGHGCAQSGYSGVYTRVAHFRKWINRHADV